MTKLCNLHQNKFSANWGKYIIVYILVLYKISWLTMLL